MDTALHPDLHLNPAEFGLWALGEINSNIKRALLAEFIVGKALGCLSKHHEQWGDFDLCYGPHPIEIKSSGVITPPFPAKAPNFNPSYDIAPRTHYWLAETRRRQPYAVPTRPAELYIFCLHTAQDEQSYAPLNTTQWLFLVASTRLINDTFQAQQTVTWNRLKGVGEEATFEKLPHCVERALRREQ